MRIKTIVAGLELSGIVISVWATYLAIGLAGALYAVAAWVLLLAYLLARET